MVAVSHGAPHMTPESRLLYIEHLDDTLLKGGVILSEWSVRILRDADVAFLACADIACILTATAAIETSLRFEGRSGKKERFADLIDSASIDDDLKSRLHSLRRYRNSWVHVDDPHEDQGLLDHSEQVNAELARMAFAAVKSLRETIYARQWV